MLHHAQRSATNVTVPEWTFKVTVRPPGGYQLVPRGRLLPVTTKRIMGVGVFIHSVSSPVCYHKGKNSVLWLPKHTDIWKHWVLFSLWPWVGCMLILGRCNTVEAPLISMLCWYIFGFCSVKSILGFFFFFFFAGILECSCSINQELIPPHKYTINLGCR